MASIPENVRVLWPSSSGTPSGWTHDTNFNDRMLYSANSGSGNGGSDNHTHNGNSHSHGGSSHTHSFNFTTANMSNQWLHPGQISTNYGRNAHHTHAGSTGSGSTSGSSGASNNFNAGSTLPPYYNFRVIKSDGSGDGFPANSVILWNTASNPTSESGWSQHSGSVGKYVRASSNGGGTGGGSHSHGGGSHSHGGGGGSHTHGGGNTNIAVGGGPAGNQSGCPCEGISYPSSWYAHWHTSATTGSGTQPSGTSNTGSGSSGSTSYEPAYYSVWGITNSSNSWCEGGIAFICGESVPDDWVLCNGSNSTPNLNAGKLIKLSSSGGAVGGTGGGTSHNHSSPGNHGHSGSGSHNHSLAALGNENQVASNGSGSVRSANQYSGNYHSFNSHGHTHALTSVSSAGGGFGSATNGIASNSSHPAYRTVQWIMAPEEPSAGGNMAMFGANF